MAWIDSTQPEAPQINSIGLRKSDSLYQVKGAFLHDPGNIKKIVVYVYEDDKINFRSELENVFHFDPDGHKILLVFPIDPLHKTKRFGISTISKTNVESAIQYSIGKTLTNKPLPGFDSHIHFLYLCN